MKRLGYDACIRINNVEEFIRAISEQLGIGRCHYGPVQYQARQMHYNIAKSTNPALIKEPQFSYQDEVRALWRPDKADIEPLFVTSKAAAECCELYTET